MRTLPALLLVAIALAAAGAPMSQAQGSTTAMDKPGGFHSPDFGNGKSWNHTFQAPGIYYYHCHPHPWMEAIVEVTDGNFAQRGAVLIHGYKFDPARIIVAPGADVTWTNHDSVPHSVAESIPPASTEASDGGTSPGLGVASLMLGVLLPLAWTRRRS